MILAGLISLGFHNLDSPLQVLVIRELRPGGGTEVELGRPEGGVGCGGGGGYRSHWFGIF